VDGRSDPLRTALILGVLALSCAPSVPAMHAGTAPPLAGHGRVVFVRPSSPCDRADHARIVDLDGRFVGALGPGTWFQAPLDEEKVFAVWSSIDYRTGKAPGIRPVDVVRVAPSASGTTFITVELGVSPVGRRCTNSLFRFSRVADAESEASIRNARELVPDPAAGQALLEEDADVTRAYLEMARERAR
jgi:hypothetical protein